VEFAAKVLQGFAATDPIVSGTKTNHWLACFVCSPRKGQVPNQ
jgi:hypothetical protein